MLGADMTVSGFIKTTDVLFHIKNISALRQRKCWQQHSISYWTRPLFFTIQFKGQFRDVLFQRKIATTHVKCKENQMLQFYVIPMGPNFYPAGRSVISKQEIESCLKATYYGIRKKIPANYSKSQCHHFLHSYSYCWEPERSQFTGEIFMTLLTCCRFIELLENEIQVQLLLQQVMTNSG